MRFITKLSVVVAAIFVASTAFASGPNMGNLENGKNIFTNGKGDVPACVSCHGDDAMGSDAMGRARNPR